MMSKVVKSIMVRVIKSRLAAGESLEDIFKSYPKLTAAEIEELTKAVA